IEINATKPVRVTAFKAAHRGEGFILRLRAYQIPQSSVTIHLSQGPIKAASLCDARERDLKPLEVEKGMITLSLTDTLTTLRLILD
ncbi:MAG: glycosyl hydrolase-related protein, partial [Anaerolineales bacterium]